MPVGRAVFIRFQVTRAAVKGIMLYRRTERGHNDDYANKGKSEVSDYT
ncbi:hypothetical protein B4099_0259 [Heyndrickxia coagulans]|uniref:Uncharacterized protein n=1 Tax=Heyndrickxia coagulans TaxID=1398 RepID=A0A150KEZ6_HEYCO|nr:hypothetical protein B4099_0259 [Heyndrickxia coagulans]